MKKKYRYYVSVDAPGHFESYWVEASSSAEAKRKAKDRFVKEIWKRSSLKAYVDCREEVKPLF